MRAARGDLEVETEVDSRNYVFALPIRCAEDIPRDFGYRGDAGFLAGVFLPRDDPDWFGRSDYPARLLLLFEDRIEVIPHPKARKAAPIKLLLEDLEAVESGRALLIGWIRFHGREITEVPYNRRTSEPVDDWLGMLRHCLCRSHAAPSADWRMSGDALDVKFRNALLANSEQGEEPAAFWFKAPIGQLIAVMPNRVLWITDRMGRFRERYGYVAKYAPWHAVKDFSMTPESVRLTLKSGAEWAVHRDEAPRPSSSLLARVWGAR